MTTFPATFGEAEMIEEVSIWVAAVLEKMDAAHSREDLEAKLCDRLRRGMIDESRIIRAANNGDEIADAALCKVYAERANRREDSSIHLTSYALRALERRGGPLRRGRGRAKYDNFHRDLGIVVLVFLTAWRFNLAWTRNQEQQRPGEPSASSIVAAALGLHRINVREGRVQNLWVKLHDHLWLHLLADEILSSHQIRRFEFTSSPPDLK